MGKNSGLPEQKARAEYGGRECGLAREELDGREERELHG